MAGTPTTIPLDTVTASVNEMLSSGDATVAQYRRIASEFEQMAMGAGLQSTAGIALMSKVAEIRAAADRKVADQNEKANSMTNFKNTSVDLQASQAAIANAIPIG